MTRNETQWIDHLSSLLNRRRQRDDIDDVAGAGCVFLLRVRVRVRAFLQWIPEYMTKESDIYLSLTMALGCSVCQ